MLVSLAVLSLALVVVGIVFSITTKTASQSAAYSQTHNWVRQFMDQIEEDLRYCDPSQSVLVLVGRTQAAALTADDLAAGKFYRVLIGNPQLAGPNPEYGTDPADYAQYSDPRADLLMFFTNRPTVSAAPNPSATNDPYAGGVKFSPIRVVYGHAALADALWGGTAYTFPPAGSERHIEQMVTVNGNMLSRIPATRWHLSRVATIVEPPPGTGVTDTQFTAIACQNVAACVPYTDGVWGRNMPGDAALLNVSTLWQSLGAMSTYWSPVPPLQSPYAFPTAFLSSIDTLMYVTYTAEPPLLHHVATVLEDVPVELQSNMGVHLLPGCVWFQVEFLMPEDPRNSAVYSGNPTIGTMSQRSDMPRWTSVQPGFTYVFAPDTQENRELTARQVDVNGLPLNRLATFGRLDQELNGDTNHPGTTVSNRIIRLWPYAIRITVRVWDAQKRLDEPIVRSFVHRFE
jgi:hypothetical protein